MTPVGESFIHLDMVRSQDDPATEAVAQINDGHTEAEANHIGERYSERDDQNLRWTVQITVWEKAGDNRFTGFITLHQTFKRNIFKSAASCNSWS